MKHAAKLLMTVGMIVTAFGILALFLNLLDFANLPDNCPRELNCEVLEANYESDRRERLAITSLGIISFALGWVIWRLHRILAPGEKNWS